MTVKNQVDPELRAGFKIELEAQMVRVKQTLQELIDMHDRYGGETVQRTYLYKARNALIDGLAWFDWEREHPRKAAPADETTVEQPSHGS